MFSCSFSAARLLSGVVELFKLVQEQDRETAGRVGELSAQLKACESHKGMLQRSKWMLTAAAREKDDVLVRLM